MYKKTAAALILIAILSVGLLASCSSTSSSSETKFADEDFINSLARGLEDRWDIDDKLTAEGDNSVQGYRDCIQAELDQLEKYQDADFEDPELQKKAKAYIDLLNKSMEVAEYAVSDTEGDKWMEVFDQRTVMLRDFVDNYGLKVGDRYQERLDEYVEYSKTVQS